MKIHILHIISSLRRGGRERQLSEIVSNTDFEKYATKIIYFNKTAESYLDEYSIGNHTIRIKSKQFWPRFFELNRIIIDYKPDLVYTWGYLESLFILLLRPFHNFIFINGSIRHGIRSRKFSHYFRTMLLHLSQYVVANSFAGLKANNIKKGKILYNGIDKRFIGVLRVDQKNERKKALLGLAENQLLIISVANMVPYKDYFSVLDALKLLNNDGYSFFYLILGDGPLRSIIEQKIAEYSLVNRTKILGNVQNVDEYLKIADIFIHSSKGEGCSNAILEAMAAGLPIIASKTGGTPEIVNYENGYLFEYHNPQQLKDCIVCLLENEITRHQLGENSLLKIKRNYTIQKMMSRYYQIIEECNIQPNAKI